MSTVHLECTEEQAAIVCRALDAYMRLCGLGQFGELAFHWAGRAAVTVDRARLEQPLREFHYLVMPTSLAGYLGASYGIHATEVPDEYRASFDLQQVVRHALHLARPESDRVGYTVDAYPARRTSEKHALAKCEVRR